MINLFRHRDITQSYNPGIGPASDWRGYTVVSMAFIVSEYRFTQGDYNNILVIMSDMDSEGSIETVKLSDNKNHNVEPPTITAAMAREEAHQWFEAMNIEMGAFDKRDIWVKFKKSHNLNSAKILPRT